MAPSGSPRADSGLAVRYDHDLSRPNMRMDVSGERDRLLHAGDRGMESFTTRPPDAFSFGVNYGQFNRKGPVRR